MPLRHEDTKNHKELIFNELALVQLSRQIGTSCALVPPPVPDGTFGRVGGNKSTFQSGLKGLKANGD
jgi:hypothetical protein